MKHIKIFEDFSNEISEAKKKIKPYASVQVGDMAMENPDAGGQWNHELGEILWKGTYEELLKSEYKNTLSSWEEVEEVNPAEYDLLVVNLVGKIGGGPTLFNYHNDPSGCVVFENKIIEEEKSPQTVNDMDVYDDLVIDGIKYVNLISPEVKLVKGSDGKPKIQGVKVGLMVDFVNEPAGHEDKGKVEELGKTGVFVDNGSGIETYCAFKLRPISDGLVGFALVHKE